MEFLLAPTVPSPPRPQNLQAIVPAAAGTTAKVVGGRYGLGSKDTPPSSIFAVYEELAKDAPKHNFTLGITDDVTNLSLEEKPAPNTAAEGTIECKFWGLGGDGTVGANKDSIKIIGDHTDTFGTFVPQGSVIYFRPNNGEKLYVQGSGFNLAISEIK